MKYGVRRAMVSSLPVLGRTRLCLVCGLVIPANTSLFTWHFPHGLCFLVAFLQGHSSCWLESHPTAVYLHFKQVHWPEFASGMSLRSPCTRSLSLCGSAGNFRRSELVGEVWIRVDIPWGRHWVPSPLFFLPIFTFPATLHVTLLCHILPPWGVATGPKQ